MLEPEVLQRCSVPRGPDLLLNFVGAGPQGGKVFCVTQSVGRKDHIVGCVRGSAKGARLFEKYCKRAQGR